MYRFVIPLLIVAAFAVAAEYLVGWRSLLYPWLFIDDPLHVLAAATVLVSTYAIRALRIYRFFRFPSGFLLCLRLLLQHNLSVNVLPLKTGELAFPLLMRQYFAVPVQRSLPALLWLRMLDLHSLLLAVILLVGLAFSWWWAALSAALWIGLPFAASSCASGLAAFLDGRPGKMAMLAHGLFSAVPHSPAQVTEVWLLTVANWIVKLVTFAWIIELFAPHGYVPSLAGAIGGELTMVLPIQGLAGFGTYEAGVVAAMSAFGVSVNDALTGAVNLHFVVLGVSFLAAALTLLVPRSRAQTRVPARP